MVPVGNLMGHIAGYSEAYTLGLVCYISYEVVKYATQANATMNCSILPPRTT